MAHHQGLHGHAGSRGGPPRLSHALEDNVMSSTGCQRRTFTVIGGSAMKPRGSCRSRPYPPLLYVGSARCGMGTGGCLPPRACARCDRGGPTNRARGRGGLQWGTDGSPLCGPPKRLGCTGRQGTESQRNWASPAGLQ